MFQALVCMNAKHRTTLVGRNYTIQQPLSVVGFACLLTMTFQSRKYFSVSVIFRCSLFCSVPGFVITTRKNWCEVQQEIKCFLSISWIPTTCDPLESKWNGYRDVKCVNTLSLELKYHFKS